MERCQRCHKETGITTMSIFNTQMICMDCEQKERAHPRFEEAMDAEMEALRSGNFNFPGIGKPSDL